MNEGSFDQQEEAQHAEAAEQLETHRQQQVQLQTVPENPDFRVN